MSLVRVTDEGSEQSERAIYAKQKFARSTDASHPTLIRRLSPPPSPKGRLFSNRDSAIKFYFCVRGIFSDSRGRLSLQIVKISKLLYFFV